LALPSGAQLKMHLSDALGVGLVKKKLYFYSYVRAKAVARYRHKQQKAGATAEIARIRCRKYGFKQKRSKRLSPAEAQAHNAIRNVK
jgi:hypothetical protein